MKFVKIVLLYKQLSQKYEDIISIDNGVYEHHAIGASPMFIFPNPVSSIPTFNF
jgi:hypothetical protein